jgi:hypothetical protein
MAQSLAADTSAPLLGFMDAARHAPAAAGLNVTMGIIAMTSTQGMHK